MMHDGQKKSIGVTILGSTGTIGGHTLDVISQHADRFHVVALTANSQIDRLFDQCKKFKPEYAVLVSTDEAMQLESKIKAAGLPITVLSGTEGLERVAEHDHTDYVMAAIVGAAGLAPTLAAARSGKRILLANKEALVMSGQIFMDTVENNGARLLPIDSEHNAIFQCMPTAFSSGAARSGSSGAGSPNSGFSSSGFSSSGFTNMGVRRILLTASGGPFRETPLDQLNDVTPDQACAHPNWVMGKKISIDSATMMNKGLEVIEACWLFDTDPDHIQVVLHPQSVIHSMVEYVDGSVLAQLGNPDMRTPIAHALAWPERLESGVASLDIFDIARLDFEPPDFHRFPCLQLAIDAMKKGGTSPTVLNAANEVAVQAFIDGDMRFIDIANVIEHALSEIPSQPVEGLKTILDTDRLARDVSQAYISQQSSKLAPNLRKLN
jgi:1-deoxy-D-xylulose-5-phosphate reductoisomerase